MVLYKDFTGYATWLRAFTDNYGSKVVISQRILAPTGSKVGSALNSIKP
jgi:hypothetical protein